MKKFATKLMLLSTAALAMLGSCEKPISDSNGNENSASVSVTEKDPTLIKREKEIPYMQENIALNLDNYISIEYSDGSTDKEFELSTNSKAITIDGHKIKGTEVGTFYVTVSAGGLVTKLTVNVISDDQYKMISFLSPLEVDRRNFTVEVYGHSATGQLQYGWTIAHNANYSVVYDPDDPFALDDKGDPDSFIIAKLADGNGYFGYITEGANHTPVPVFKPGIQQNYDWFLITMDLELNAADSTYVSLDGEDVLLMSATFCESLAWSAGITEPEDDYGNTYPFYGAVFKGFEDINIDGNPDIAEFDILVGDDTDNVVFRTVKISAIGSTELAWMNAAVADASFIPAKITSDEIPTAFQAANAAGNFTLTVEAYAVASKSTADTKFVPAESEFGSTAAALFLGTCDAVITEKYTSTGVYTEFKGKKLEQTTNGYTQAADYSLMDISAVWNDSGAAYSTRLTDNDDQTAKVLPARSAIAGVTDVFQMAEVKQMAANNVTAAGANVTNWTSKETEGTKVIFAGDVGDHTETTQTNLLAAQVFGLLGGTDYGVLKDFAGTWTKAEDGWGDGGKHSYSRSSDYRSVSVDTATNEVVMEFLMYAPFSDITNNYFVMKFTLSDIGTTTFDFSTLTAANANPGILA